MTIAAGTRLGPYEILAPIGAGGMGEVYRAHDTKLNRDVALKFLSEAWATDSDRLARFTREAQALAHLNHPNIAHVYGFEDTSSLRAIVMELVDGPTLAVVLASSGRDPSTSNRGLPIGEVMQVGRQVADALEAAHEAGIIHRDLKPANIKIRADGTVKVLDFGVAKALDLSGASDLGL